MLYKNNVMNLLKTFSRAEAKAQNTEYEKRHKQ